MKAVAVLFLVGACNQPEAHDLEVPTRSMPRDAGRQRDRAEPVSVIDAAPSKPAATRELVVDAGNPEPWEPSEADCYYLADPVVQAWPLADDAIQNAAARWGHWYVPGDGTCLLRVLSVRNPRFGDWGRAGDILLDPTDREIVDGDNCEGDHYLLIDVFTHELGYVYGLQWTGARGRAMSTPEYCKPVVPTAAEIKAAE